MLCGSFVGMQLRQDVKIFSKAHNFPSFSSFGYFMDKKRYKNLSCYNVHSNEVYFLNKLKNILVTVFASISFHQLISICVTLMSVK